VAVLIPISDGFGAVYGKTTQTRVSENRVFSAISTIASSNRMKGVIQRGSKDYQKFVLLITLGARAL
jgi:hypothetical protein